MLLELNDNGSSKRRRITVKPKKIEMAVENDSENLPNDKKHNNDHNLEVQNILSLLSTLPALEQEPNPSENRENHLEFKFLENFNLSMGYQDSKKAPEDEEVKRILADIKQKHGDFKEKSPIPFDQKIRDKAILELLDKEYDTDGGQASSPDAIHQDDMMRIIRRKVQPIRRKRTNFQQIVKALPTPATLADVLADPARMASIKNSQTWLKSMIESVGNGEPMPPVDDVDIVFILKEIGAMQKWSFPRSALFLLKMVKSTIEKGENLNEKSIEAMRNLVQLLKDELEKYHLTN